MKIVFYGARDYDHLYFDLLAADPAYGCTIRFLAANLDADTAPLARGGDAVCAFVNSDCSAPVLEALSRAGIRLLLMRCAGYNNVDLPAAARLGITVLRVPGYSPEAVAEHAMALAQAANRRICKAYIKVRNNNFALDGLLGHNLYGACAGIVGTGRIGAAMARICHGYGMTVLACDQYENPALAGLVRYVPLEELLRAADLVSLHCPLTAETRHLINAKTIAQMRDHAILVNTSRGALIDTAALIDALRRRKFAASALMFTRMRTARCLRISPTMCCKTRSCQCCSAFPMSSSRATRRFSPAPRCRASPSPPWKTPAPSPAANPLQTKSKHEKPRRPSWLACAVFFVCWLQGNVWAVPPNAR